MIGHINWVLFVEERYRGNVEDYYDARNSYLNEVIDRRTGIPISLSALYLAIAERVGLPMSGVNLPAHFLIRTVENNPDLFVDPFHEGAILDHDGCQRRVAEVTGQPVLLSPSALAPCDTGTVVARMLRNLKAVWLKEGDYVSALPVIQRLAALESHNPLEQRDLGVVSLHADRPADAITPLNAYLTTVPEAEDAETIRAMLRVAQREVASWN